MGETPIQFRHDLLAGGVSSGEIRSLLSRGRLIPVGRGIYLGADGYTEKDAAGQHLARIPGILGAQSTPAVVSHLSAALLYGLPLWDVDLRPVHLTKDRAAAGRRSTTRLKIHTSRLDPSEIVLLGGLPVTSVSRTVLDVAMDLPLERGIAVADDALHRRLVTATELHSGLAATVGRRGRLRAEAVIGFAHPSAESPGESWSRLLFHRAGIPQPELQVEFRRVNGTLIARVDFYWRKYRLIGEFDGLIKYTKFVPAGKTAADVVVEERARERELMRGGDDVLRWVWGDLRRPDGLIRELRSAMRLR